MLLMLVNCPKVEIVAQKVPIGSSDALEPHLTVFDFRDLPLDFSRFYRVRLAVTTPSLLLECSATCAASASS